VVPPSLVAEQSSNGGGARQKQPLHGGVNSDLDVGWASVSEKIRRGVSSAGAVERGAANLGPLGVVQSETVVGSDPCFQQGVANRGLPRLEFGSEHDFLLHPPVRLVHQRQVPRQARPLEEIPVGSAVEARVDGAAAAKNPPTRVGHSLLRNESLRGRVLCLNVQEVGQEPFLVHQVGVPAPSAASFKHKHFKRLRERRRQRAPRSAATHDDVVVVFFNGQLGGVDHHLQVTGL